MGKRGQEAIGCILGTGAADPQLSQLLHAPGDDRGVEHTMDEPFWARMHAAFSDADIVDLAINFLGGGRFVAVLDLSTACPIRLVEGQAVNMDVPQQAARARVA